ncbi:MAG TPA: DUF6531 domain-containing protein, partial [Thermoanaerobaculia bacterium]
GRVLIPVAANRPFEVVGVDASTGLQSFRRVYDPQAAGDPLAARALPSPIDNQLGPYPVFASPARVEVVDIPAADVTLTSVRNFELILRDGVLRITPGSVPLPPDTRVEILNTSTSSMQTDDSFVAGDAIAMPAGVGDRIVMLIGEKNVDSSEPIAVVFNRPVSIIGDPDDFIHSNQLMRVLSRDPRSGGAFADITRQVTFDVDSGNRRITMRFDSPLQLGKQFRIAIGRNLGDDDLRLGQRRVNGVVGPMLSDDLHIDFSTREPGGNIAAFDLRQGAVRDLALNGNIALVSALDGGLQAFDVSDPASLDASNNPRPIASVAAGATEFWAVASDHHGRIYTTGLTTSFGVLRTYRLADFLAAQTVTHQVGAATVSWRPGINSNLPLGTETIVGDRAEATPRKLQIVLQDDELEYTVANLTSAFSGNAVDLGGGFRKISITLRGDRTIAYQTQRVTVENRSLDLRWSVDVPRGGTASLAGIIARDDDRLFVLRNRATYGVISLFGYGISVFDLNAVESNDVMPSEANYVSIREQVALSKGTDPAAPALPCDPAQSAATGAACPIRDLAFSPEALIRAGASSAALKVFALDAAHGVLDLNVTPPSLVAPASGGLTLASTFIDQPRLRTLRELYRSASGRQPFAHFTSISSYKNYALIAGNQFGLVVIRLDGGALDWEALVDVVWIPAGAYSVRVMADGDMAVVVDGAGRVLLVDLKKIDEASEVTALPTCTTASCSAQLFPTARKAITSAASPLPAGADWTEVGADDPRIVWKSAPHVVRGTLPPLVDPSTGFLFTGDVNTSHMSVVAAIDPRLRVVVNTGSAFGEVGGIVPLGIDPPPNIVSGPDGSLAAFRVEATLPANMANGRLNFAVETEQVPGAVAAQTPVGFPRAHLRIRSENGDTESRPGSLTLVPKLPGALLAEYPALRYQRGTNHFVSPWVVAIADPRASRDYIWPGNADKRALGCPSCDRPRSLQNDPTVLELWSGGNFIRIRPEMGSFAVAGYAYLSQDHRFETRVGTFRGDLVRPSDGATPIDRLVAKNLPTAGTMNEQVVNLNATEVQHAKTDLAIKGRGMDFVLMRFYSSAIAHVGPFGRNFDSPLFARVRKLPNGDIEFYDGTGRRDVFADGVTPPLGVFVDMRQSPDGRIVVQQSDNTRLYFDSIGRLFKMTDRNTTNVEQTDGNAMIFSYDATGRLAAVLDPVRRPIRFEYNISGLISRVVDFDDRVVRYTYDDHDRLVRVEGPDPQSLLSSTPVTTYAWGPSAASGTKRDIFASGELISEKDGMDRTVWAMTYDSSYPWSARRLESGGGSWTFELNNDDASMTDPRGFIWKYVRDAAARITSVVDPGGSVTTYAFDADGRPASVTRPLGDGTNYTYGQSRPNGDRRPMANVTTITELPRSGSAERAENALRVTTVQYGPANLPTLITTADGSTTTILRDGRGNPQSITDATGIATSTTYDNRGLLRASNDPRNGNSTFDYDANGNLKSVTTSAGTTAVVSDSRGNVQRVTDPSGRGALYTFNELDQLESETRGNSFAKSSYDAAGNLSRREVFAGTDSHGDPVNSVSMLAVDELGRVRTQSDNGRLTTTTYSSAGNVTRLESTGIAPVIYTYDSRGRIDTLTIGGRTSNHFYDENGEPSSVRDARGNATTFL